MDEQLSAIAGEAHKQIYEAAEAYFDLLRDVIPSFPSSETRLGEKLKSLAKQNIAITREYVRKMSQAKTEHDVIQIETEYETQFNAFSKQAKDLMEACSKAAESAIKVPRP